MESVVAGVCFSNIYYHIVNTSLHPYQEGNRAWPTLSLLHTAN